MVFVLLFCTAEEAKPFAPRVLSFDTDCCPYFLVQSRQHLEDEKAFKEVLRDGETFETDFIGASVEECGSWALLQQEKDTWIEQDIIAIVDKQSPQDETIILAIYPRDAAGLYLAKDQQPNKWYAFRVPYQKATEIRSLPYGDADEAYGVYFHRKDELTDEHGVFDTDRAGELFIRGEGFVFVEEEVSE